MTRRNMSICVCRRNRNRQQEVCVERCRQEGKYRYLDREPLAHWELPPELPPFREVVEQARKNVLLGVWNRQNEHRDALELIIGLCRHPIPLPWGAAA